MSLKRIFVIGLTFIVVSGLTSCVHRIETFSTDFFVFELNHREKHATAIKLTDLGKEQEVLAIPPSVENYPVRYIGVQPILGDRLGALMLTDVQKKIYLPLSLNNRVGIIEASMMDAVLNISSPSEDLINSIKRFYEADLYYLTESTKLNTFFMLNFDSSENEGYYWMDYNNGSNPYIIPSDPVREGYTFEGWYYEEECISLWNNEVPESESESLILYAKWL